MSREQLEKSLKVSRIIGALGGFIVQRTSARFSNVKVGYSDRLQIRRKGIQHDPQTPAQLIQRQVMSDCAAEWRSLTEIERQAYRDKAKGTKNYGYTIFSKDRLRKK